MNNFTIIPSDELDTNHIKLDLSQFQKNQLASLTQMIPNIIGSSVSSNLYTIRFPEGLSQTLTALKQGGYSTALKDPETGLFVGSASMYKISPELIFGFSLMAIVTGQYYLAEINKELTAIDQKIDTIIEFLYGDKKAELLSEISFVKYAYHNFSTIMQNDSHKTATISSIQDSRKIAMRDIEFYINDLNSTISDDTKSLDRINDITNKSLRIHQCIELSIQLYLISTALEVYYSLNTNKEYLSFLENEMISYIEKCDKRLIADFNVLKTKIHDSTALIQQTKSSKIELESSIEKFLEKKHEETISSKQKMAHDILFAMSNITTYTITSDGDLYCEKARNA